MGRKALGTLPVVMLADVVALVTLRHCPFEAWRRGTQLRAWLAAAGPDATAGTLAGAAIWMIAAWVALALIAVRAARLPGLAGVLAGRVSRAMVPCAVRMLLTGGAGLGVLITSTAAGAAPTPVGSLPAPRWPVSTNASIPAPTPTSTPVGPSSELPAPIWPSTGPRGPTPRRTVVPTVAGSPVTTPSHRPVPDVSRPAPVDRPTSTSRPDTSGSALPKPSPTPPRSGSRSAPSPSPLERTDALTVHAGDSLWMLAAQRLATARHGDHVSTGGIAAEWPRWYQANRAVVGNDPDLLVPGQVLHVPAAAPTVPPGPPVANP